MDTRVITLSLGFVLILACKTKDSSQQFQGVNPMEPGISRQSDGGFVGTPVPKNDFSKWSTPQIGVVRVPIADSDLFAIGLTWNTEEGYSVVNEVELCNKAECWSIKTVKNMAIYYAIPKEWENSILTAKLRHCPDTLEYKKSLCSPMGEVKLKSDHFPGISGNEKLMRAMQLEQEAIDQGIAVHAVITEQAFSLTEGADYQNLSLLKNIAHQGPYAFSESMLSWDEEAAFLELAMSEPEAGLSLTQASDNKEAPFTKQDFRLMDPKDQKVFAVAYHNPRYCGKLSFVQGTENLLNGIGEPVSKGEVDNCLAEVKKVNGGQVTVAKKGMYIGGAFSLALGSGMILLGLTSHFPRSRLVLFPLMAVLNLGVAIMRLFDGQFDFRDFYAILNINDAIYFGTQTGREAQDLRSRADALRNFAKDQLPSLDEKDAKAVLSDPSSSKARQIIEKNGLDRGDIAKFSEEYKAQKTQLTNDLRYFSSGKTNLAIGGVGVIAAAIGATLIYKSTERSYGLVEEQLSPEEAVFGKKLAGAIEKVMPTLKARRAILTLN